jgi:hypothetical protein
MKNISITLCVTLFSSQAFAQVPPPPPVAEPAELSEEEKSAKARDLYVEAEGLSENGDWTAAVELYDQAYHLLPGKHGFAYKVGIAAWNATPRDCNRADDYLKHYARYGDANKHPDWMEEAKRIIGEVAVSNCRTDGGAAAAQPEPEPEPEETGPVGGEGPDLTSRHDMREEAAAEERDEYDATHKSGMFKGGIALTVVGVAALGGAGASLALANNRANKLAGLSSSSIANTSTGFPAGDWDCRVPDADCPSQLDRDLKLFNGLWVGLLAGGSALAATGIALIVVDAVKKKKQTARVGDGPQVTAVGPTLLRGGAGASATVRF